LNLEFITLYIADKGDNDMSGAILDGERVSIDDICPEKHTFIGTFRSPVPPRGDGALIMCFCGRTLYTVGEGMDHWQQGHFDTPQYKTIT